LPITDSLPNLWGLVISGQTHIFLSETLHQADGFAFEYLLEYLIIMAFKEIPLLISVKAHNTQSLLGFFHSTWNQVLE
jgi:hypothetical protein